MTWTFERVADAAEFSEGPVWDGDGVVFTDMPNDRLLRYDAATGETAVHRGTGVRAANGLALGPDGAVYACEMNGRRVVRYESATAGQPGERDDVTVIADSYDGHRLNGPNDLCFDASGRIWFSDSHYQPEWVADGERRLPHESVYRVDPGTVTDGADSGAEPTRLTDDTTRPNGVLLSPDEGTLYVAQSDYRERKPTELRAYPIGSDGSLGEYRVLHDFAPHRGVDGMCRATDGTVIACAGWAESGPGPSLYVFDSEDGLVDRHPFPAGAPTNCAFGGPERRTLYVTEKEGGLYRTEPGFVGDPLPP